MKSLVFSEAIAIANNHIFVLNACVEQITKDLGLELDWFKEEAKTVEEIVTQLEKRLEILLFNSEGIIHQLLYRVDLNEEQLYAEMNTGNHKSLADLLSKAIVERELKKVIMRNIYNGKLKV